jgi:NitT/TauT family transport system substrate-binding protein
MNRTMTAVSSLIQGTIDVMSGAIWPSHLNAIGRGARIKFVASKSYIADSSCICSAIVARRDLIEAGLLTGPEQLSGLRVSLSPSSCRGFFMEKLLGRVGMTMEDVETVDLHFAVESEALRKGTIDIAIMSEPWLTRMKESGDAVIWKPLREVVPRFQWGFILYGPTLLDENPDAGVRFMVAYLKGVRQYWQGKTERNVEILVEHTKLDRDLLKKACWPAISIDGQIDFDEVTTYQKWADEEGLLNRTVSEEEFWDRRFVEYARQILHGDKQESLIDH